MADKFKTKKGRLTHYALACGYIEQHENNGFRLTLWHEGGPTFHVRMHDAGNAERVGAGRVFWESFEKLSDARHWFDEAKSKIDAPDVPALSED